MDILPRFGSVTREGEVNVQLTQLSAEYHRRQYGVLFRSLTAKNREKARERRYLPVCLHLTQNADRLKRLDGHEKEI